MAAKVTDQGLQRIGVQASQATSGSGPTYSATRHIQVMSIDDSSVAFADGHTALNSGGAVSSEFDMAFDASGVTRSGLVVSHVATIPTGSGNFTIRRIALHDNAAGSVDATTSTLIAGVDGQSIVKTSDFTIAFTLTLTYAR